MYLTIWKQSIVYEKDFLGTIDEDARTMFDILKKFYEDELKGIDSPYAHKFGKGVARLGRYFD